MAAQDFPWKLLAPSFLALLFASGITAQETARPIAPPPAAAPSEDGQWIMPTKNYANTRYSGLDEINAGNVAQLRVAFSFSTGVNRGQEAAPIVAGDTMYVVTPFRNLLHALDLTQPDAPMKWRHDPAPDPSSQGVACCDTVNRGPAFAEGRIHYVTLYSQAVAVDAATGKELWKVKLGDINKAEKMTMAPLSWAAR